MRIRQRTIRVVGTAVIGLLVLVGCSSDGEDDDAGSAGADLEVVASEYQFSPSTWTVGAGEFSVAFTNEGTIEHEWAVLKQGEDISSGDEFAEDKVLLEIEAIAGGASTTESVTIDEPGTYQVICALPGHFDEGMEGTLTVE